MMLFCTENEVVVPNADAAYGAHLRRNRLVYFSEGEEVEFKSDWEFNQNTWVAATITKRNAGNFYDISYEGGTLPMCPSNRLRKSGGRSSATVKEHYKELFKRLLGGGMVKELEERFSHDALTVLAGITNMLPKKQVC